MFGIFGKRSILEFISISLTLNLVIKQNKINFLFCFKMTQKPAYPKVCEIIGLILAIASFFIPFVGVFIMAPLAMIVGSVALYGGGSKGFGIAILILSAVKIIISPMFWLYLGVSAVEEGVQGYFSYFVLVCFIVMLYFLVRTFKSGATPIKGEVASEG